MFQKKNIFISVAFVVGFALFPSFFAYASYSSFSPDPASIILEGAKDMCVLYSDGIRVSGNGIRRTAQEISDSYENLFSDAEEVGVVLADGLSSVVGYVGTGIRVTLASYGDLYDNLAQGFSKISHLAAASRSADSEPETPVSKPTQQNVPTQSETTSGGLPFVSPTASSPDVLSERVRNVSSVHAVSSFDNLSSLTRLVKGVSSLVGSVVILNNSYTTEIAGLKTELIGLRSKISAGQGYIYYPGSALPTTGINPSIGAMQQNVSSPSGIFENGVSAETGTFTDGVIGGSFTTEGSLEVGGASTLTGSLTVGNTLYVDAINGRVGIGTSTPTDTFSLNGPIYLTSITPAETATRLYNTGGDLYWAGNLIGGGTTGNWTSDGTHAWRAAGNVGIGTTSPGYKLSVVGSFGIDGYSTLATTTVNGSLTVNGNTYITQGGILNVGDKIIAPGEIGLGTSTPNAKLGVQNTTAAQTAFLIYGTSTQSAPLLDVFDDPLANNNLFRITSAGNVGIGTTTPYVKLSIAGDVLGDNFFGTSFNASSIAATSTLANLSVSNGFQLFTQFFSNLASFVSYLRGNFSNTATGLTYDSSSGITSLTSGYNMQFATSTSDLQTVWDFYQHPSNSITAGTALSWNGNTLNMATSTLANNNTWSGTNLFTQNVGIGTTSPYAKLSVVGEVVGEYFTATSTTATSTFAGGLIAGGLTGLTVLQNGSVGIGTTNPSSALEVNGTIKANAFIGTSSNWLNTVWTSTGWTVGQTQAAPGAMYGDGGIILRGDSGTIGFTTGAYATYSRDIGLSRGAAGKLYIGNSTFGDYSGTLVAGTVGVGTTTPYSKLTVWGSGTGSGQAFEIANSASTTIAKFLDNGTGYFLGNIGIGTTTPYAKLAVVGEAVADYFTATSLTGTTTVAGSMNVGSGALTYDYSSGITDIANLTLGAQSFESDAGIISWADMPVTTTSAVGTINSYSAQMDSNPILTVYGESLGDGNVWNGAIGIGTTTPYALLSIAGISTTTVSTTRPLFDIASSSGSSFLRMAANGNLGLGTTTPAWLAQLVSSTSPQLALTDPNAGANLKHWTLRSTAGSLFIATSTDLLATSTLAALTVSPNGYLGVATTSPWMTFSVQGTVAMNGLGTSQGNAICITAGGEITNPGASSCTGSSERFKDNIQDLAPGFALEKLSELNVVSFDYKEGQYSPEDRKGSYGMIAEAVAGIDPNLVDYGYDGKPLTLKFEKFVGLFVQAIQELVAKVTGLETKINTQQQEIDALKERMDALDGQTSAAQTPLPSELPISPESTTESAPETESVIESDQPTVESPAPPAPESTTESDPVPVEEPAL